MTTTYYTYSEIAAMPHRGLTEVVDMTWDRRDRGGEWLIVERGQAYDYSGAHRGNLYTRTGKLVATSISERGARNRAGKAQRSLRRQGVSGLIDIVRRGEVTMRASGAPYGCLSGEGAA